MKRFTVRLPSDLYRAIAEIAGRRHIGLNALVQEGLIALVKQEEYRRLYDDFGLLGDDAEECDVEFAVPAQWEVVSRDDTH